MSLPRGETEKNKDDWSFVGKKWVWFAGEGQLQSYRQKRSKHLGSWPKNDFIDINIFRLFNRECDCSCY
jgi:hypothetical protein